MRVALLNPNTSAELTDRMARLALLAAPVDVEIEAMTAPRGFPYISNTAEAQVAGTIMLEMLAQKANSIDVAIIGAFGDPGLRAARDLFQFPVIGISEASILTASMMGRRFGIVGFATKMRDWYVECVTEIGLERRLSGFRAPRSDPRSANTAQEDLRDELIDCILDCHRKDGADVVIVAGAPLAGFARTAATVSPVPLVDPVMAGVLQAHAVARHMALLGHPDRDRADPKATTGLDPLLAAQFLGGQPPPRAPAPLPRPAAVTREALR